MASIQRHGKGWRAFVDKKGVRKTKVFSTKSEATQWAAMIEHEIVSESGKRWPTKTVRDLCVRYAEEVSPTKRGERAERLRLEALCRDFPTLADKLVHEVATPDLVAWRQARLKLVTPGAVRRDANIIRNAFRVARDEWHWLGDSPFAGFKIPQDNPPRDRLMTAQEVKQICRWFGYRTGDVRSKQQEIALALLIACRTGMRSGEILSLTPDKLDLARKTARVPHKTQHITGRPREIPLSRHAVRLLRVVADREPCFTIGGESMSSLFRKACMNLGIKDLHFHDSRALALTMLSKKVSPLDLARISGHRDLGLLVSTYYRATSESIADRL